MKGACRFQSGQFRQSYMYECHYWLVHSIVGLVLAMVDVNTCMSRMNKQKKHFVVYTNTLTRTFCLQDWYFSPIYPRLKAPFCQITCKKSKNCQIRFYFLYNLWFYFTYHIISASSKGGGGGVRKYVKTYAFQIFLSNYMYYIYVVLRSLKCIFLIKK